MTHKHPFSRLFLSCKWANFVSINEVVLLINYFAEAVALDMFIEIL